MSRVNMLILIVMYILNNFRKSGISFKIFRAATTNQLTPKSRNAFEKQELGKVLRGAYKALQLLLLVRAP